MLLASIDNDDGRDLQRGPAVDERAPPRTDPEVDPGIALQRYLLFLQTLDKTSIGQLERQFAPDVRFSDPLRRFTGVDKLREMYEQVLESCHELRIEVRDAALSDDRGMLFWHMAFVRSENLQRKIRVSGATRVVFGRDGRVTAIEDFWDSGQHVYERLPVVGGALRAARRLLN